MANLTAGIGLEIAPLDNPIVSKQDARVRYVDIVDTPGLRAKYGDDPNVSTAGIVEVDHALQGSDGKIRSLPEVVADEGPYDWVVASHVIEHAPDLIGWLAEVAEILADDGAFLLMVPDRRYTFDVLRPQTTVGQILQAHTDGDVVPSERAVYDHFRSYASVTSPDLWAAPPAPDYLRVFTLQEAAEYRQRALDTGEYSDSHVWVFTPTVFVEQIVELGELDLCDFTIERIVPTAFNELEFSAVLRRLPRGIAGKKRTAARSRGIQSFDELPADMPGAAGTLSRGDGSATGVEPESGQPLPVVPAIALSHREFRLIQWKRRIIEHLRGLRSRI